MHIDGSVVRARREALDLSREALGAEAGGVSLSTIRRIERGEVHPERRTVAALARALGCDLNDLNPAANGVQEKPGNGDARREE